MSKSLVVYLEDCGDVKSVGGKALALGKMIRAGFKVPLGFVITTDSDKMTEQLKTAVIKEFDQLKVKAVAVRSSAIAEDGANDAWAGQMDTFLNIDKENLISAIEKCWASADSDRAIAYGKQKGLAVTQVAVIIQAMIQGEISGVAFSVHPVTKNHNHLIIEAVQGLGESLVSGTATPDSYVVDKKTDEIIEKASH